jgi:Ca-activated chloride channel family protein
MEEKELISKRFSQYEDRFQIFLMMGLVLIILEFFIPERKRDKKEWRGRFV